MSTKTPLTTDHVVRHYLHAKRIVIESGFASEVTWQRSVCIDDVTEATFLRETAWVVLSSGMRETVIRSVFPRLTAAFHDWRPHLVAADADARSRALRTFGHVSKIDAILTAAQVTRDLGSKGIRHALYHNPDALFDALPYIGPVTRRHLAKTSAWPWRSQTGISRGWPPSPEEPARMSSAGKSPTGSAIRCQWSTSCCGDGRHCIRTSAHTVFVTDYRIRDSSRPIGRPEAASSAVPSVARRRLAPPAPARESRAAGAPELRAARQRCGRERSSTGRSRPDRRRRR